jgi:hypothetical protein
VPIVLKSGSLNRLEPSGPVKACNGISLPFLPFVGVCYIGMCVNVFILSVDSNLECDRSVQLWGARKEFIAVCSSFSKGVSKNKTAKFSTYNLP